jgi:iron(III) transport system substrate-binding protein
MGLGTDTVQRIVAERRAGKYIADLYLSGTATGMLAHEMKILAPIKPALILPEVADSSKWWKGKHRYGDAEDRHLLVFAESVLPFAGYNSQRVNPKEFTSYWDFLQPKWKGKIVAFDPTMGSAVNNLLLFLYEHPELGPKFLRALLTEMSLGITRDRRQLVDWLGTGRYELSFLTTPTRARLAEAKEQGLPVGWFSTKAFKEGSLGNTLNASVGLLDRAPHPNAARLAINWLLSREGQMLYQRLNPPADSLRIDISKESVPEYARREGVRYMEAYTPTQEKMEPVYRLIHEARSRNR